METDMSKWTVQFPRLLDRWQFNSSPSDYLNHIFEFNIDTTERNKKNHFYFTCLVVGWTLLYAGYSSYLNAFFKQRNFSLVQRKRIIDSLWSWTFHLIGLFYLRFYHLSEVPSTENTLLLYFIYFLMKSFCLHFAGVKIFSSSAWMTGFCYLLFTLFVFNDFDECFNPYILYVCSIKIVDILILEACRFLFILWKDNYGNVFSMFLFTIHCIYWTYMYFYFVPNFLLSPEKDIDSARLPYFYLWYICECIDSVFIKLFKYNKTEPWLKTYLFQSSKESAQLMNIYKRHEEGSHQKDLMSRRLKKQIDLWKTVRCAIAVKKTLHRKWKAQKEQRERREVNVTEEVSNAIEHEENKDSSQ